MSPSEQCLFRQFGDNFAIKKIQMQGFFTFFVIFVRTRFINNNLTIVFLLNLWYNMSISADVLSAVFLFAIAFAVAFLL